MPQQVSAATLKRVRDYACTEPSFTIAFAAWELELSPQSIGACVHTLLDMQTIREVEPRSGPYAAVYAYNPTGNVTSIARGDAHVSARVPLPELDAEVAMRRAVGGAPVPHTRAVGTSGKPGADKRKQSRGVRVKRQRQGT